MHNRCSFMMQTFRFDIASVVVNDLATKEEETATAGGGGAARSSEIAARVEHLRQALEPLSGNLSFSMALYCLLFIINLSSSHSLKRRHLFCSFSCACTYLFS